MRSHLISFTVMVVIGLLFNPMNILAYRYSDLYLSKTLFYGGLLMASNMIWGHEIIHYLSHGMKGRGHFNISVFSLGVFLSIGVSTLLLREQLSVDDDQWLRRMIPHHSTALTTTHKIYNRTSDPKIKDLAKEIIETQEKEISLMKSMLSK